VRIIVQRHSEVLEKLNQTLEKLAREPEDALHPVPNGEDTPRQQSPVGPVVATPTPEPRVDPSEAEPNFARPAPPKAPQPAPPAGEGEGRVSVFGVFEQQKFDLCGYRDFTARITQNEAGPAVTLSSEDRSIPERTFRGYERTFLLQTPVRLWKNCTVGVGHSTTNGISRIVFSVDREE
jgi:hypothetical protein